MLVDTARERVFVRHIVVGVVVVVVVARGVVSCWERGSSEVGAG
jgi:hypothetical protein